MKRAVLFAVIALLASMAVHAQEVRTYRPVLSAELVEWNGVTEIFDGYPTNHYLYTGGDTIVDGMSYTKIMHVQTMKFLFREDSVHGRLWCRYPQGVDEFVIYDISLEPGDPFTFTVDNPFYDDYYTVIDTMTVDNLRIVILQSNLGREIKFIEGVGCSIFFDYITRFIFPESHIICCHKDRDLVYYEPLWPGQEGCVIPYESIEKAENVNIFVGPNPCRNRIYINGTDILSLAMFGQHGQEIFEVHTPVASMDMSMLPPGVYYLRITSSIQGNVLWKKIIKR